MKNTKFYLINFLAFLVLVAPVVSFAGLVPTCAGPCGFKDLLTLVNTVITFIIKDLALPIAAIMFAYAGFLLVTAGGGEGKTKAKAIFTNTVIGLIFAVACWIIVKTVLSILGYTGGAWIGF